MILARSISCVIRQVHSFHHYHAVVKESNLIRSNRQGVVLKDRYEEAMSGSLEE